MSISHHDNPFLAAEWHRDPPPGTGCEPLRFPTPDRAMAAAWLYQRGREDTVVVAAHPRVDFARHYAVPGLVDAGFAVLTVDTRFAGDPSGVLHEAAVVDLAEALADMRRRFDRVVLLGNSGGGPLMTFYLQQALAPAGERLTETAAGRPYDLNRLDLPAADLLVLLASHPGEGHHLLHAIDPSVTDESDPLSRDPSLDMYEPSNGFREPPHESRYEPEFLDRYRAAQRARVARLDEAARHDVERRRRARARWKESGDPADRRESLATRMLTVYRTDAEPRCTDLGLDPSARTYGSLFGTRPDWTNHGAVGLARVVTPESWLSTWSATTAPAELRRTGPGVTTPTLHASYSGDHAIFPSDGELICSSLGSRDLSRTVVDGDHYGFPVDRGRDAAIQAIAEWIGSR